jgi:sporulation-control protein spo0M
MAAIFEARQCQDIEFTNIYPTLTDKQWIIVRRRKDVLRLQMFEIIHHRAKGHPGMLLSWLNDDEQD